jgi:tetratricopeptide (TPR) repeat protein
MKNLFIILCNLIIFSTYSQSKIIEAKSLFESKKYTEANKILLTIDKKDKDFAEANYYKGRIAYEQQRYDNAAVYFEVAINENDKIADYYYWLGNAYGVTAEKANPIKQATLASKIRNAWEKAANLDPKNMPVRWSLITFYTKAPGFMGGSISKAKEMAEEIKKINPADGHRALGIVYQCDKKLTEAEKEYIEMVKLNPDYTGMLINYYIEQKSYTKAFPIVEKALVDKPNDYGWMYMFGKISALSGTKLDKGQECLEKYLLHQPAPNEPSLAGANMRLGQIYEKKANKPEAKKCFELAIKADPKLKEAKEGLARVSK